MVISRKLKIAAVLFALLAFVALYYMTHIRLLRVYAGFYSKVGLYKPAILCINELPGWYVGKEKKREKIEWAFTWSAQWAFGFNDKTRYIELARDFEALDQKAFQKFYQAESESISKVMSMNSVSESEKSEREARVLKDGCFPTFGQVLGKYSRFVVVL